MVDIKTECEGQEPVAAAPAFTNEQVKIEPEVTAPEVAASAVTRSASIEPKNSTSAEPQIKEEEKEEVEVKVEVKDEKTDSDIKPEIAADAETTNGHVKKEEEEEKKFDPNGPRLFDNGPSKTNHNVVLGTNNSKYDASVLPPSDDVELIRGQVEFYFGNSNLSTDEFLMKVTGGVQNRPVPIATIHNFKRMQRFQPYSLVVDALKKSKFLVVQGEEGKETVKRKKPFDPALRSPRAQIEARSVYIKGFGDEEPSSQFDIEAFVAPYGEINSVRLRRTEDKLFKGSVFVEFGDEETARNFLAIDPKPQWKGKHALEIKSKTQYMDEKLEQIRNGTLAPAVYRGRGGFRGRGRGRGGRGGGNFKKERDGHGDRDPNDWKKRRETDRENGFKGGRGGRGRGDRKQNGGRNDRGPRNNDRNNERNGKKGDDKEVKAEKPTESATEAPVNDKKRAREDDGIAEEHKNKKIDVKPVVTAEA